MRKRQKISSLREFFGPKSFQFRRLDRSGITQKMSKNAQIIMDRIIGFHLKSVRLAINPKRRNLSNMIFRVFFIYPWDFLSLSFLHLFFLSLAYSSSYLSRVCQVFSLPFLFQLQPERKERSRPIHISYYSQSSPNSFPPFFFSPTNLSNLVYPSCYESVCRASENSQV